jgi:hypothetical protein
MDVFWLILFGFELVGIAAFGNRMRPDKSFTNTRFVTEAVHRCAVLRR